MTTCAPGCGRCCDPLLLPCPPDQLKGPGSDFARRYWTEVGSTYDEETGQGIVFAVCAAFDRHTRMCTAYLQRPPQCRGFPYYGMSPRKFEARVGTEELPPGCEFIRDHRTLLPIVEVTHGAG